VTVADPRGGFGPIVAEVDHTGAGPAVGAHLGAASTQELRYGDRGCAWLLLRARGINSLKVRRTSAKW
jgi:hypothetical protein